MQPVDPQTARHDELIACHECDTLQRLSVLSPGQSALCVCCGAKLLRYPAGGLRRPIALYGTALILLLLANLFPLLLLDIQGRQQVTTIFGASQALYQADMAGLAIAVFITSILAPLLLIGSSLYVLLAVRLRKPWRGARSALAWISHLQPWGMLDVFMLGVLVAFVKLGDLASMHVGIALYAFSGLILVSAAATASLEPHMLWRQLDRRGA
ncbi:MAG: paraquat-inducible protein A [Chromatiales bacterium]|jgi:paraquat-inducible protein A